MRYPIFFLFLVIALSGSAQYGKIMLDATVGNGDSLYTIAVYPLDNGKPVYFKDYDCDDMPVTLDSVLEGQYILKMTGPRSGRVFFSQRFQVIAGKTTHVNAEVVASARIVEEDTTDYKNRVDMEINLAYTNDKLFDTRSVFTDGFLLGFGMHYWNAFSRHLGLLTGYGFTYRHNSISGDTSFIKAPDNYRKINEAFNYFDMHADLKLRFSGGSQQNDYVSQKFLLELGAVYNFPLYFRYSGHYQGNKKIQVRGIHQFGDVRAFVNVGYYPVVFFYEYRLTHFVISGYPELPHNTFGLRLLIGSIFDDQD